jgi:serine/threonine protein kinase
MSEQVGRIVLGRYEIKHQIARGGTAKVFLAQDLRLLRPVALKILFEELSVDTAFVERFRREAQAAANLNHPNIVSVYDWGESEGNYFIVMEYIDGRSLSSLLKSEGNLTVDRAAQIGSAVASALYYAHRHGVIHRDIKPGNVLITEDGRVKVTDFGIARALGADDSLTQTGLVMGTATYISPEQAQGLGADGRSDIYSLGVVLYEMVSGHPPFSGDSPLSIALKHVNEAIPPLTEIVPGVPKAFEAIVLKALSKDPNKRYASAGEFADDLERFRMGKIPIALEESQDSQQEALDPRTSVVPVVEDLSEGVSTRRRTRADKPKNKSSKAKLYSVAVGVGILLLGAIGFVFGRNLGYFGAPVKFKMPQITNQPLSLVKSELEANGLIVKEIRVASDAAVGIVTGQKPSPGVLVQRGEVVVLDVSSGPQSVVIPPVIGLTLSDATNILQSDHLKVQSQGVYSSESPDTVLSEDPAAGTTVKVGTVVTISYSSPNASVKVPSVIGLPLAQASAILGQAGLDVGSVTYQSSSTIPNGDVISSLPAPYTEVNPGTKVSLVVSNGSSENIMLNVIGDTLSQATALLTASPYNLAVTYYLVPTCAADQGIVVSQSPSGGVFVAQGSTVTLGVGSYSSSSTTTSSTTAGSSTTSSTTTTTAQPTTTICP